MGNILFRTVDCMGCGSPVEQHQKIIQATAIHKGQFQGMPLTAVCCRSCGLVFLQPQPEPEDLGNFYEHEYYAGKAVSPQAIMERETRAKQVLHTWLIEHMPDKVIDLDILDIGSGFGVWLQMFDQSNRLFGIEQSQQATEIARGFGIHVHQVDFMDNQLNSRQFGLVTGLAVIEHFIDPLAALIEMNRVLEYGGYLYLQTPDLHGLMFTIGVDYQFKVVHTFYFTLTTLSELLRRAGFHIIESRCRPPLVESATIWHPHNALAGELDILAQKQHEVTLEDARSQKPLYVEKPDTIMASIQTALKRDRHYLWLAEWRKNPVFNRGYGVLRKLATRILPHPVLSKQLGQLTLDDYQQYRDGKDSKLGGFKLRR